MTDDELDRALFALPLEEPPAELRERVLAATVLKTESAFAPWETWAIGTLLALAVWLLCLVSTGVGSEPVVAGLAALRASGLFDPATWLWLAVGGSATYWISRLILMPQPPAPTYNR